MSAPALRASVSEEDRLRSDVYGLLGTLLRRAPDEDQLERIAGLSGDGTDLGTAFSGLAHAARETEAGEVSSEYHRLFIGLGRGELVPYGSYYMTGFLHEKPLARLRETLGRLGIERRPETKEPEDHAGTLMEVMAGLITGAYGAPAPHATQRQVFEDHIASWAGHFFGDLESAEGARFYKPVGRIGRIFVEIESAAFAME